MIFELIVLLIILVFCLYILSGIVNVRDTTSQYQRKVFSVMVVSIILWVVTILFTDLFYKNYSIALWSSRLSLSTSLIIAYLYYLFVKSYTSRRYGLDVFFWGVVSLIFLFLTFSDLVVNDVNVVDNSLKSVSGPLQPVYAGFLGIFFLYSAGIFYSVFKKERNLVAKTQMLYMFTGSVLSICASYITNLVFPMLGFKEIRSLGPFGLIFFFNRHVLCDNKV